LNAGEETIMVDLAEHVDEQIERGDPEGFADLTFT
jgi:hypothetical protein